MRPRISQSGLIIEGGEMINSKEVKEYAKKCGADLIGIASIERFKDVPAQHNPSSIFPEAKSIIVIGRRITRGTLRGVEEGTQFDLYSLYGDVWLQDRFLAMTTFKIAEFLEDNRYEAVPLPNLPPQVPPMGIAVRPDQPSPNVMVDFDDAAMRAGLGEIGYCGILLTPEFGPRQRFQIILTDAKLEPNPLLKQKICDRCMECIKNCPLDAIDSTKEKEINICGKKMLVAEIDYAKCTTCKNGASPNRYHPAGNPDRLAAICVRSCIDHLEKMNKLKNRFQSSFRKRAPWKIGKREMDFYKI